MLGTYPSLILLCLLLHSPELGNIALRPKQEGPCTELCAPPWAPLALPFPHGVRKGRTEGTGPFPVPEPRARALLLEFILETGGPKEPQVSFRPLPNMGPFEGRLCPALWGGEQDLEVRTGVSMCVCRRPLWCGMERGWENGSCTWPGASGLALRVSSVLAEKSKGSESSKFEPSLPSCCQCAENRAYFIGLLV